MIGSIFWTFLEGCAMGIFTIPTRSRKDIPEYNVDLKKLHKVQLNKMEPIAIATAYKTIRDHQISKNDLIKRIVTKLKIAFSNLFGSIST